MSNDTRKDFEIDFDVPDYRAENESLFNELEMLKEAIG